jgi:hypothetical protein
MPIQLLVVVVAYGGYIVLSVLQHNYITAAIQAALLVSLLTRQDWAPKMMLFGSWIGVIGCLIMAGVSMKATGYLAGQGALDAESAAVMAQLAHRAAALFVGGALVSGAMIWALTRDEVKDWLEGR